MRLVSRLVLAFAMASMHCLAGDLTDNARTAVDFESLQNKIAESLEEASENMFFKAACKIYVSETNEKLESARAFIALDESGLTFDDERIQLLRSVLCGNFVAKMANGSASAEERALYERIGTKETVQAGDLAVRLFTHIDDERLNPFGGSKSVSGLLRKAKSRIDTLSSLAATCHPDVKPLVMLALMRLTGKQCEVLF